jgi:CRISPR-associated protein Csm1
LHDAGKFFQKGSFGELDIRGKHPAVSARFIRAFKETFSRACDFDLLETMVMKHHEHPSFPEELRVESAPGASAVLALLVSRADNYSSSERGDSASSRRDYQTRPLDSVFCRLEIGKPTPSLQSYRARPYAATNAFPEKFETNSEKDLNNLLQSFGLEFSRLADTKPDFYRLYTGLYALFMKYAWCIPSNSQEEIADVSLYDHLKTTSAIASCLYLYHSANGTLDLMHLKNDSEEKFLLAVGDISGIQNYIFSGISIGAGGMARKLRARSFSISMFSELAAQILIRSMSLPVANVIMSAGGKFYVLMPNNEKAANAVRQLQLEADRWFLEEYKGELSLNLACHFFSGREFASFGTVTETVSRKLAYKKQRPYADHLQDGRAWQEDSFMFDVYDKHSLGLCQGCGREFAVQVKEDRPYGKRCLKEMELGQKIPRTQYLQLGGVSSDITLAGGLGVNIHGSARELGGEELVYALNNNSLPEGLAALPKELANHIPTENGRVQTFEEIIGYSRGTRRLGLLKADVDNLGKLFAFGLTRDDESFDTISRMTTLSRMLDHFFSGYINHLLREQYPHCYTVYSGGDDLIIIGPWNQVIGLAGEIYNCFRRFAAGNDNLTLSAGIAFARSRTPVIKTIEVAETLLERAKEHAARASGESRNQVSIFGRTMTWSGFAAMAEEGERLASWAIAKKIGTADLRRLKLYDRLYRDYLEHNKVEGLCYKAFLAYQLGRMKKDGSADAEVLRWHEQLLAESGSGLENLGAAVDYAISIIREGDASD